MLAERKTKQKWTLNPRGNTWVKDNNKFGQRILEKMGWRAGKGLGAKETGMTECPKIKYKNDTAGVGYQENPDGNANAPSLEYSNLLMALNEGTISTCDNGGQAVMAPQLALEQRSKSSKVRVHYSKFTKGKDLSRRSEKELASIFGCKALPTGERASDGGCVNKAFDPLARTTPHIPARENGRTLNAIKEEDEVEEHGDPDMMEEHIIENGNRDIRISLDADDIQMETPKDATKRRRKRKLEPVSNPVFMGSDQVDATDASVDNNRFEVKRSSKAERYNMAMLLEKEEEADDDQQVDENDTPCNDNNRFEVVRKKRPKIINAEQPTEMPVIMENLMLNVSTTEIALAKPKRLSCKRLAQLQGNRIHLCFRNTNLSSIRGYAV